MLAYTPTPSLTLPSEESVRGDGLSEASESVSDRTDSSQGVGESDLVLIKESDRCDEGENNFIPSPVATADWGR